MLYPRNLNITLSWWLDPAALQEDGDAEASIDPQVTESKGKWYN